MFSDAFGVRLKDAPTRWIEPPWKAVLSNKGILPLLWEMFPGHPNLLPAYFEDDPRARELGVSLLLRTPRRRASDLGGQGALSQRAAGCCFPRYCKNSNIVYNASGLA